MRGRNVAVRVVAVSDSIAVSEAVAAEAVGDVVVAVVEAVDVVVQVAGGEVAPLVALARGGEGGGGEEDDARLER